MLNPLKMKAQATELLKDYLDSIHARLEKMNEQMQQQLELIETERKDRQLLLQCSQQSCKQMDLLILEIRENNSAIKAMMLMQTANGEQRTVNERNKNID